MVAVTPFNYMPTINAAGSFTTQTDGVVQGTMMDDPAARWALRSGVVDVNETLVMWGGVGIYEHIPNLAAGNPDEHLGSIIGRATTVDQTNAKGLVGFCMFNQAHNMVVTPQSPVPLSGSGMTAHYVRLGTGARICVAADPSLAAIEGGSVGQQVSWDFNAQVLQPYNAADDSITITSATWASTNGGQITVVAAAATNVGAVGDAVTIAGATNSGTGGAAAVNRTFYVSAFTDNQNFILAAPAAAGVIGTIAGSPVVDESIGALTCRVDRILPTGNMTVVWDSVNSRVTWNYNGCAAIITI